MQMQARQKFASRTGFASFPWKEFRRSRQISLSGRDSPTAKIKKAQKKRKKQEKREIGCRIARRRSGRPVRTCIVGKVALGKLLIADAGKISSPLSRYDSIILKKVRLPIAGLRSLNLILSCIRLQGALNCSRSILVISESSVETAIILCNNRQSNAD